MATAVTETSDPVLWDALRLKWLSEGKQGWVVSSGTHYNCVFSTNDDVVFIEYSNNELFDSRSITNSRSASYGELDEG